jgi:hypothetical protein
MSRDCQGFVKGPDRKFSFHCVGVSNDQKRHLYFLPNGGKWIRPFLKTGLDQARYA